MFLTQDIQPLKATLKLCNANPAANAPSYQSKLKKTRKTIMWEKIF